MAALPRLYAITDRELAGGLDHDAIVALLCRGGATLVQMREKLMIDRDLLASARAAVVAAHDGGARLVLNDRPDVARLAGADGVHVGGEDLPAAEARAVVSAAALLGVSTHSVDEAIAAAAGPVDYVALGPVFATSHSSVSRTPLGLAAVERAAGSIGKPLVAIGGFDLARAREAIAAGAASVAVMGDLMLSRDIPSRVAAYLAPDR